MDPACQWLPASTEAYNRRIAAAKTRPGVVGSAATSVNPPRGPVVVHSLTPAATPNGHAAAMQHAIHAMPRARADLPPAAGRLPRGRIGSRSKVTGSSSCSWSIVRRAIAVVLPAGRQLRATPAARPENYPTVRHVDGDSLHQKPPRRRGPHVRDPRACSSTAQYSSAACEILCVNVNPPCAGAWAQVNSSVRGAPNASAIRATTAGQRAERAPRRTPRARDRRTGQVRHASPASRRW